MLGVQHVVVIDGWRGGGWRWVAVGGACWWRAAEGRKREKGQTNGGIRRGHTKSFKLCIGLCEALDEASGFF